MKNSKELITQSAVLRGQGQFDEAIKLIEDNLSSFVDTSMFNAQHEIFLAAKEKKDIQKAQELARKISEEHPGLPSIQKFL